MSKTFEVKLNCTADEMLLRAQQASRKNGVQFAGDHQVGKFAGHGIEGSYQIVDDTLYLKITKKPFIMPWTLIESKFRGFFV